jgi:hypothetical protein
MRASELNRTVAADSNTGRRAGMPKPRFRAQASGGATTTLS